MKKLNRNFDTQLNEQDEMKACVDLLDKHWNFSYVSHAGEQDSSKSISQRFVEIVFEQSKAIAQGQYAQKEALHVVDKYYRARGENLKRAGCTNAVELFDGVAVMLARIRDSDALKKNLSLHDQVMQNSLSQFKREFENVEFAVPKNYRDFMNVYRNEGERKHAIEKSDLHVDQMKRDFQGVESLGSMENLPEGISLSSIAFFEKDLGYPPFYSLTSCIAEQGLTVSLANNTAELCKEIWAIDIGQNFVDGEVKAVSPRLSDLHAQSKAAHEPNRAVLKLILEDYKPRPSKSALEM